MLLPPLVPSSQLLVLRLGHLAGQHAAQGNAQDVDGGHQEDAQADQAQVLQQEVDDQAVAALKRLK